MSNCVFNSDIICPLPSYLMGGEVLSKLCIACSIRGLTEAIRVNKKR